MAKPKKTFYEKLGKKILSSKNNQIIQFYLKILGIESISKSNDLVYVLESHPEISAEIHDYLDQDLDQDLDLDLDSDTKSESKIDFLLGYSSEQVKYITNPHIEDAKLIACAGSGKTRSIIGRIKFIVDHSLQEKENVYMITFSKHAALDFRNKVSELFPNHRDFCVEKNFSTIDSMAKSILYHVKSHKSENVEILSIALRNYLKSMSESDVDIVKNIKDIKHLFVDEAQDLNEVQFDIICLLKEKFGTVVELIGDCSQNIYQFRRSNSSYLMNFDGKIFELTRNFRSTQQIIDFAECLKPIKTVPTVSATNKQGPPISIVTDIDIQIHKLIIEFIRIYEKEKDISNIAIICPTRGIGLYNSLGLAVFFNLFKINKIPFVQMYDESAGVDRAKKDTGKVPGHINLITYHGTKGLEFDVVFVMDFYQNLSNIQPTEIEHNLHRYLLYVATSRAISMMYICTYTNVHGGYLNHWLSSVASNLYHTNTSYLRIPKLVYRNIDIKQMTSGVTEILSKLSDEHLNTIHDYIKIPVKYTFTRKIYQDFSHIDRGTDEILFGTFCDELFNLQYNLSRKISPRKYPLIQIIIDSKFTVVSNEADYRTLKTHIFDNNLSWKRFDVIKDSLPQRVKELVLKYFSREVELAECVICTTDFVKIVESNMVDIRMTYDKYLDPVSYQYDYRKILSDFFYLIVVQYAYKINHYFYISGHGNEKAGLLKSGKDMFEKINNHVINNYWSCNLDFKKKVCFSKLMLMGEMDFVEKYPQYGTENIVEIKCAKEIGIKYYIQLLLYNFCYQFENKSYDKLYWNKYKIINLLTGLEYHIIMGISPENMFNLLTIIAQVGNLRFRDLNLVYDLETTNKIKIAGPFHCKPNLSRSKVYRSNNKFYANIYPEIIEIAIKDYETGMVVIDTLVCPKTSVNPTVQKLTGITNSMLSGQPILSEIKIELEKKMKNFINCKMMAHNGKRFDDQIILYDQMVNSKNIIFLDTLSIIPIHYLNNKKLKSKKLSEIYYQIFKVNFDAHRAMADVDAIIKIMSHLKIKI